jgi:hypothetical protein
MNSDIWTKWTTIFTNTALVLGLIFVGLEFRSNTQAIAAERVDSFVQGTLDIILVSVQSHELTEIIYRSHSDPESLSPIELDRVQYYLFLQYNNFMRVHSAYEEGLLSEKLYETEKVGIGFAFSGVVARRTIELMQTASMSGDVWKIIGESAEKAQSHCLDPKNRCASRYEAAADKSSQNAP